MLGDLPAPATLRIHDRAARVRLNLSRSRPPRQIAGGLRLEALDPTVETMTHSPDAQGATASYEAIYRWIYALPKGDLAKSALMLRSKQSRYKRTSWAG